MEGRGIGDGGIGRAYAGKREREEERESIGRGGHRKREVNKQTLLFYRHVHQGTDNAENDIQSFHKSFFG